MVGQAHTRVTWHTCEAHVRMLCGPRPRSLRTPPGPSQARFLKRELNEEKTHPHRRTGRCGGPAPQRLRFHRRRCDETTRRPSSSGSRATPTRAAASRRWPTSTSRRPGCTIDIDDIPYDDFNTRLRNAAQADGLPDFARVTAIDPIWMDQLEDLGPVASEHGVMENLLTENEDGEVPTFLTDLTAVGLYVNKSLFDEAGVALPDDRRPDLDLGRVRRRRQGGQGRDWSALRARHGPVLAPPARP